MFSYRQRTSPELRVIWEHLEEINEAVALLQKRQNQQTEQWNVVSAEQKQHCSDLASIYQQLQELFFVSGCGYNGNNRRSEDSGDEKSNAAMWEGKSNGKSVTDDSLKNEISDILQSFKNRIEQHIEETNRRFDDMQKCVVTIQQSVEDDRRRFAQQEERLRRLEEREEQLRQSTSLAAKTEDVDELREELSRQLLLLTENSLLALRQHGAGVDETFANHEARRQKEQEELRQEAAKSVERAAQRLTEELSVLRHELQMQATLTSSKTCGIEERTARDVEEALRAHAVQTCQQIQDVQRELDEKHSRLVKNTTDAIANVAQTTNDLPRRVSHLQEEVGNIHSALQRHGEVLGEHCLQGSLRGAFDEVKDWLKDLERRTISHGEFDEAISKMESKIAALRQDFIMSASSQHAANEDIDKRKKKVMCA